MCGPLTGSLESCVLAQLPMRDACAQPAAAGSPPGVVRSHRTLCDQASVPAEAAASTKDSHSRADLRRSWRRGRAPFVEVSLGSYRKFQTPKVERFPTQMPRRAIVLSLGSDSGPRRCITAAPSKRAAAALLPENNNIMLEICFFLPRRRSPWRAARPSWARHGAGPQITEPAGLSPTFSYGSCHASVEVRTLA
jgi:hypothetical protein